MTALFVMFFIEVIGIMIFLFIIWLLFTLYRRTPCLKIYAIKGGEGFVV